jgi:transposase-like protein
MTLIYDDDKPTATDTRSYIIPTIGKRDAVACPKCNSKYCDRIKRGGLVKILLPWLKLKRYRCSKCQNRFYKRA